MQTGWMEVADSALVLTEAYNPVEWFVNFDLLGSKSSRSCAHVCIYWQRKINGSLDRQLQWWRLGVVEAVTVVEGSLAYCGVLHVLRCSSGQLFWLPWLQSGHMTIRLYTSHMHIHPCTNLGHEHTQIHTYSEFQLHSNLCCTSIQNWV